MLSILIASLFLFCLVVDLRPSGDGTVISHISLWFETFDLLSTFLHSASHSLVSSMAMKVIKRHLKDTAKMDDDNRAMCYALRHPPGGAKPFPLHEIQKLVPVLGQHRSRY